MLAGLLGLPETPLVTFLSLSVAGLATYFGLSGLSYFWFFVKGRARYHPNYQPNRAENRTAMFWGTLSILGNAVLTTPLHLWMAGGHSKLYYDVADHGWGYLIGSYLVYMVLTETGVYWAHRFLHTDFGYKYLHAPHHQFKVPTSWVSVAFNPLDSFLQGLPHHLIVFVFPVHAGIYFTMLTFITVWAVMIHDGVSYVRWRGINFTGHHTLHHWYYDYNYGQFFTFWDRLAGTYKDPDDPALAEEIPAGILSRG